MTTNGRRIAAATLVIPALAGCATSAGPHETTITEWVEVGPPPPRGSAPVFQLSAADSPGVALHEQYLALQLEGALDVFASADGESVER